LDSRHPAKKKRKKKERKEYPAPSSSGPTYGRSMALANREGGKKEKKKKKEGKERLLKLAVARPTSACACVEMWNNKRGGGEGEKRKGGFKRGRRGGKKGKGSKLLERADFYLLHQFPAIIAFQLGSRHFKKKRGGKKGGEGG